MRKAAVIFALLFVSAASWAQSTVKDGMARLEKQYGVRFVYDASLNLGTPAGSEEASSLTEALSRLFGTGEIQYELKGNYVILKKARRFTVSGTITDASTGETLIGAGVFSGAGSASPDGLEVVFYTGVTPIPAHIFDTASIDEYGKGNQPYAYVTSVICAPTVNEVGNCAFRSCQSLETVQFYGKDAAFGESVFDKCISPSFCISAPDGGAIRTYAEENKLTFKTFSGNEVLPEIGEPETAVPAQQEAETAGESSTVEPKADSADKAKTDISSDSAEPESWTCPNGHTGNTGRFCPVCGSEKP